jgi:hypothetical protein
MTKTILTIAGALALTTPFFATKNQPTSPIETVNQLNPPIENIVVAGSYSSTYNIPVCTRDGFAQTVAFAENNAGEFTAPIHCKETNCGLGVYSLRKDSEEERCSFCGALKPVNL